MVPIVHLNAIVFYNGAELEDGIDLIRYGNRRSVIMITFG